MAAVVFDLDGTLIDSAPDIQATANSVLSAMDAKPLDLAETISFVGNGAHVFVRKMRKARALPEAREAEMLRLFLAGYENAKDLTRPYPDAILVLEQLIAAGHELGLCTNKPEKATHAILRHIGLDRFFPVVIGGDTLPLRKPDPAPLMACFDALADGPRIYIGDSEVDAQTAQNAQVPFLLFEPGYRSSELTDIPHSSSFKHYADLPDLIDQYA